MAKQNQAPSPYVVYHVEVTSKRGYQHSDSDARDLLAANRARLNEAGISAQLNRSFGIRREDGTNRSPVIVLDIPRETDPKKTQTNPSAFFAETERVMVVWYEVTDAETPQSLPEGAVDLGKAVGGPTTTAAEAAGQTAEPNITEQMKHAAG